MCVFVLIAVSYKYFLHQFAPPPSKSEQVPSEMPRKKRRANRYKYGSSGQGLHPGGGYEVASPLEKQIRVELEDSRTHPTTSNLLTPVDLYLQNLDRPLESLPISFSSQQLDFFLHSENAFS